MKSILKRLVEGPLPQKIHLRGASQDSIRLWIMRSLTEPLSKQVARKFILTFADTRQMSAWLSVFEAFKESRQPSEAPIAVVQTSELSFWGRDRLIQQERHVWDRIECIDFLLDPAQSGLVLTTWPALMQMSMDPSLWIGQMLNLGVGQELVQDQWMQSLVDLGYRKVQQVSERGTFAVRGGIVDVYPSNHPQPFRIESIGDEIDSIRAFDPDSQRSRTKSTQLRVFPSQDFVKGQRQRRQSCQILYDALLEMDTDQKVREGLIEAFDLHGHFQNIEVFAPLLRSKQQSLAEIAVGAHASFIFPEGIQPCLNSFDEFIQSIETDYQLDLSARRPTLPPSAHFAVPSQEWETMGRVLETNNPMDRPGWTIESSDEHSHLAPLKSALHGKKGGAILDELVKYGQKNELSWGIVCRYEEQKSRIESLLRHREIECQVVEEELSSWLPHFNIDPELVYLFEGALEDLCWLGELNLLLISDRLVFAQDRRKTKSGASRLKGLISSFRDLKVGDLVIHRDHGLGRYSGLEKMDIAGQSSEFLKIIYAGEDKIYVPVDRLSLLQKYSSSDGVSQGIDRLKSSAWQKRKSSVKRAVRDMAEALLKIGAQRKLQGGVAYAPPSELYYQFEAEFPYEETDDQLRAIQDVAADMSSSEAMDRLICGDVGFGKTEVALRAAFRAVCDHRQVIVLVPTTILSHQHYRHFHQRMHHHGVIVHQLNRFVSKEESRQILEDFKKGQVDVLIGTHRLLSKDVSPHRLGLLVVDEEQRFGVGHKERIKEIKANCDVLTLTATPIPRTLHMSMLGLKDISIIATPPIDRRFVKTYISAFDESLIHEAIEQEIHRGGQVFFVHNRVEDIEQMAQKLREINPRCRIVVAHGQMQENQLERVVVDFIEHKFDLLLCTTIIESGIDMPNVNTLIANRADRFGLAQLYQLRGRVGRSPRQAYAYFLVDRPDQMSDDARKRLDVLMTYQDLGSGFQIASHDLEIRGAGNLLGAEQSGRIAEVGFEMYTEMLEQAIEEVQTGVVVNERVDVELKLPFSLLIPINYMPEERERLQAYKSIFSVESEQDLRELSADLRDRYGDYPHQLALIFKVAELKLVLTAMHARKALFRGLNSIEITFSSLSEDFIAKLLDQISRSPAQFRLFPDYRLELKVKAKPKDAENQNLDFVDAVISLLEELR